MPLDGVKNIILVLSGKGGVGKSSVTLQLALALTLQGKSVGILDIDLTGPSIPRLVGLEDAKITQTPKGWLPVLVHDAEEGPSHENLKSYEHEPQQQENTIDPKKKKDARGSLRCMSLGFLLRDRGDAVIWRGPKKTAMIRQFLTDVFWGETDYLLVDTPPGTSDEHIALAEQLLTVATTVTPTNSTSSSNSDSASSSSLPRLAGAVLVTTPQAIATADVRKEINFCMKTRIPTLGVIENMSGYACPCCGEVTNLFSSGGGQVMAQEMGVPFLGTVPVDVKFGELVEGDLEDERDNESADEDERVMEPTAAQKKLESDDRPLVERYKDCWSLSRFEEFAKTLISKIEG